MSFFDKFLHRSPEEEAARAEAKRRREDLEAKARAVREAEIFRQNSDMRALEFGRLPMQAVERLREIGSAGSEEVIFTSDFSPEEAALLRREGYRVRGIVT